MAAAQVSRPFQTHRLTLENALAKFLPENSKRIQTYARSLFIELQNKYFTNIEVVDFSSRSIVLAARHSLEQSNRILKIQDFQSGLFNASRSTPEINNFHFLRDLIPSRVPYSHSVTRLDIQSPRTFLGTANLIEMEDAGIDICDQFMVSNKYISREQLTSFFAQYLAFWNTLKVNKMVLGDIRPENIVYRQAPDGKHVFKHIDFENLHEEGFFKFEKYSFLKTTGFFPPAFAANRLDFSFYSFPLGSIFYSLLTKKKLFPFNARELNHLLSEQTKDCKNSAYFHMIYCLIDNPTREFYDNGKPHPEFRFFQDGDRYRFEADEKSLNVIDHAKFVGNREGLKQSIFKVLRLKTHPLYSEEDTENNAEHFTTIILKLLSAGNDLEPSSLLEDLEQCFPGVTEQYQNLIALQQFQHAS